MKFDPDTLKILKSSVFEKAAKEIALTVEDENGRYDKCACCCDALYQSIDFSDYVEDYKDFFCYIFNKQSDYKVWWPTPQGCNELNPKSQTARIIALTLAAIILREMKMELRMEKVHNDIRDPNINKITYD